MGVGNLKLTSQEMNNKLLLGTNNEEYPLGIGQHCREI
jgi:hypothetical protein